MKPRTQSFKQNNYLPNQDPISLPRTRGKIDCSLERPSLTRKYEYDYSGSKTPGQNGELGNKAYKYHPTFKYHNNYLDRSAQNQSLFNSSAIERRQQRMREDIDCSQMYKPYQQKKVYLNSAIQDIANLSSIKGSTQPLQDNQRQLYQNIDPNYQVQKTDKRNRGKAMQAIERVTPKVVAKGTLSQFKEVGDIDEEQIGKKMQRINKMNEQIRSRLQRMLNKMA